MKEYIQTEVRKQNGENIGCCNISFLYTTGDISIETEQGIIWLPLAEMKHTSTMKDYTKTPKYTKHQNSNNVGYFNRC